MKTLIRNFLFATMALVVHQLAGQNMTLDGSVISITEGSSIKVKGNLEITAPVEINNSGEIRVGGNWLNNGPDGISLSGTSGKVILDGEQPQTIGGELPTIFSNLHLMQHAALDAEISISGLLQLENAKLSLNKMDINILSNANIGGMGAAAWLVANGEGKLFREVGADEALFPVGTGDAYLPALIANTGTVDNFGVNVFDDVLTDGTLGSTIPQIENTVVNTWAITEETPGGSDLSLTLWWNSSSEGNLFDRLQCGIGLYADGEWQAQEAGAASGDDPYSLTRTAITQTGAFAVGDINSPMAFSEFINEQVINLPGGWSGWSSYIDPSPENDFASIMATVVNDMIISLHFTELYYPSMNINSMNPFGNQHGYITKMSTESALTIQGIMAEKTINLKSGWNLMPVVATCNLDAAEILAQINGLIIAYEVAGNGIFFPQYNINTLQTLVPGKAYYVKVQNAVEVTFPDCGKNASFGNVLPVRATNITPWNEPHYTGASHLVIFAENAVSRLQQGDMIGAFTKNGLCAGMAPFNGKVTALALFGDDPTTPAVDGFSVDEKLSFRLWRVNENAEYPLEVTISGFASENEVFFAANDVSVVNALEIISTGIHTGNLFNTRIFPNPSSGLITISSEMDPADGTFEILSTRGEVIVVGNLKSSQTINLTHLPKGIYILRLACGSEIKIEKLVIQ